jgi:hypothetical protein
MRQTALPIGHLYVKGLFCGSCLLILPETLYTTIWDIPSNYAEQKRKQRDESKSRVSWSSASADYHNCN